MSTDLAQLHRHELWKVEEAAAYLRVSEYAIRKGCEVGSIPSFRIGKRIRIQRDRLLAALEAGDVALETPQDVDAADKIIRLPR